MRESLPEGKNTRIEKLTQKERLSEEKTYSGRNIARRESLLRKLTPIEPLLLLKTLLQYVPNMSVHIQRTIKSKKENAGVGCYLDYETS